MLHPQAHPGIDESLIERLVRHFYSAIQADKDLGPIFIGAIDDWEPHLKTMVAFWSSVMLTSGKYKGRPVPKHVALSAVTPKHFDRWLALFKKSTADVCDTPTASAFNHKAMKIAESLKLAMFGYEKLSALKPANTP